MKQAGRKLQVQLQENQKLINENPTAPINADFIRKLELEAMELKRDNIELKEENQKLINEISKKTRHTARNAGRKPSSERKEAVEQTRKLLESGASSQEIMEKLKISRSTFFRYKKSINN